MKRILTSTLLLILTMALIPVDATLKSSQTNAANSQSQRRINVRTIVSPRSPVGIGSAAATMTDNQIVLQYALDNGGGGRQPASAELLAFILDESGRVKGGEGWTATGAATQSRPETLLRIMKTGLEAEDRIVLTVWRAGSAFEVNETELNNILRPHAARREYSPKDRMVKTATAAAGEYCMDRIAIAKTSCSCGVKSFSCNPSSGEWSFTCYTKAESPASCVQSEGESD